MTVPDEKKEDPNLEILEMQMLDLLESGWESENGD
jgi:hypothetical protein